MMATHGQQDDGTMHVAVSQGTSGATHLVEVQEPTLGHGVCPRCTTLEADLRAVARSVHENDMAIGAIANAYNSDEREKWTQEQHRTRLQLDEALARPGVVRVMEGT